jgi:hypothetical protein
MLGCVSLHPTYKLQNYKTFYLMRKKTMPLDPEKNKIINLGTITEEPEKIADQVGFTKGNNRDQEDWFKFTLDKKSDFNLTLDQLQQNADVILYGSDRRSLLDTSKNQGQEPENINNFLDAGSYFLKVVPKGSDKTDYLLSLNAITVDRSGDELNLAENLGSLGKKGLSANDSIGFTTGTQRDFRDYYKFNLNEESDVTISLDELKQNANIELLDRTGSLLFSSSKSGVEFDRINTILEPDTYYVLVEPFSSDRTDYRLNLVANPDIKDKDGQIGNNLKKLTTSKSIVDDIGFNSFRDTSDFYEIELKQESAVSITLDGLKTDANLELYDRYSSLPLYTSDKKGTRIDKIEEILPEDTYYVRVKPKSSGGTSYKLGLATNKDFIDPDGLFPGEDLGELTQKEDIARRGTIGFKNSSFTDKNDYYQFALKKRSEVGITLDDLDANANIRLLDINGREIAKSDKAQRNSESILETLSPGTYSLHVYPFGRQRTDYRFRLNADPVEDDYPNLTLAKELGNLNLQNALKERNKIGFKEGTIKDENDFYRFELSDKSEVSLTLDGLIANADIELLDKEGKKIDESKKAAKNSEQINQLLEPGSYYVNVLPFGAQKTPYRLELRTEPYVDEYDSLETAKNLGALAPVDPNNPAEVTSKIRDRNRIGFKKGTIKDENDFFRFEVTEESNVSLVLDGLNANAELELLDKEGKNIGESKRAGKSSEQINQLLEPGSYYVNVLPFGAQKTPYRLELKAEVNFEEYDSLETAKNLGALTPVDPNNPAEVTSKIRDRNRIGFKQGSSKDENDFFRFELTEKSDISLVLDGLNANAELELLDENGKNIDESKKAAKNSEQINQLLEPGTYYAKVLPFGAQKTNYRLELSASPGVDPDGNLPGTSLGDLTVEGRFKERDRIGFKQGSITDEKDYYSFTLSEPGSFSLQLDNLTANANATLFKPIDPNLPIVDESNLEVIWEGTKAGKNPESFQDTLAAGSYYVKLDRFGAQKTNYNLTLNSKPIIPLISIEDASTPEGNIGIDGNPTVTNLPFEVKLSEPSPKAVTVNYAVINNNATPLEDYNPVSGTLTFAPEDTSEQILVPVLGDNKIEPTERFLVELSAPVNGKIPVKPGANQARGIIENDDLPKLSIADVTVTEGNSGTSTAVLTLSLDDKFNEEVRVEYVTADGTATKPSDYTKTSGTLVVAPNLLNRRFKVPIKGDKQVELDETFTVELLEPKNAEIADGQTLVTIQDNDLPRISIDEPQVSLPEGNLGSDNLPTITNYPFNVSLSSVSPKTVTVNYTVEGKNATVGEDFTATTGTLSFAPEETTKQIFVPVLGDNSIETIEKFFVKLSAPVDAKLQRGGDEAMGIIQNDDFPKVSVADVTVTEKNSGTTDAVFTVSLDAALQEEVSVEYVTADGTATKLSDYIRTSGVVVFRPGQTSRRFSVPVKGDELVEGNETFIVNLINPENADIADGQAVATIIDNDVAVEPRSRKGSDFLTDGGDSDRSSSGDYTVIAEFGDDGGSFGGYGLDGAAVSAENEAELIGIAEDSGFSFV